MFEINSQLIHHIYLNGSTIIYHDGGSSMKKYSCCILALLFLAASVTPVISKCMYGRDWEKNGKKIVVCVQGDSFADRKRGKEVCEKVKGSSCDTPSTFSSSCGNGTCYDADGKNHYSLSGY